jgi:hypothetical protein
VSGAAKVRAIGVALLAALLQLPFAPALRAEPVPAPAAPGAAPPVEPVVTPAADPTHGVSVTGINRTRPRTLIELLPREPPSEYSDAELAETERRISNLGVFDRVEVARAAKGSAASSDVAIHVREKWTLIPDFALATGKTPRDLYISLGVTEFNVLGTASSLGVSVYREQRGFGFSTAFAEHESRRHRWAFGGQGSYGSSSLRFTDGNAWFTTLGDLIMWATSVPLAGPHLRCRTSVLYSHEKISDVEGPVRPPDGSTIGAGAQLIWDGYRFHDLVPRGIKAELGTGAGAFVPAKQVRAQVELAVTAARPLWHDAVLLGHVEGSWFSRGNANHSSLLGSIEGVRGLDDARYRNWLQTFGNLELRQAVRVFDRLALQAVVFADAAVFAELSAKGAPDGSERAFSGGLGARVIPTFLASLLFRVDVARLVLPNQTWFYQLGVSQYF